MRSFGFIIILLLLATGAFAQEPVTNTTALSDTTISDKDLQDFLSELFMSTSSSAPDSATFKKSFDAISGKFDNGFEALKGDLKEIVFLGTEYNVNSGNLPGTYSNYIAYYDSLFGEELTPEYKAMIDTAASTESAASKLREWKALLIKVFPKEAKRMTENGSDEGDSHEFVFTHPMDGKLIRWKLTLRNYKDKNKRGVDLVIEER